MNPYNPLDKANLGASVAKELLSRPIEQLPPSSFIGAGVYAIYYTGEHQPYEPYAAFATHGIEPENAIPIYMGKAIPAGGRIGGVRDSKLQGNVLYKRLAEHAESIVAARNLDIRDFHCRYLVVDDIWIPLAENMMIEKFSPLWNTTVAGFGNHDPGSGRYNQMRSAWDILHPGRVWADKLAPNKKTEAEWRDAIIKAVEARGANL